MAVFTQSEGQVLGKFEAKSACKGFMLFIPLHDAGILRLLRHRSFLNKVALSLILVSLLDRTSHIHELFVTHIVVNEREESVESVFIL